MSAEVLLVDDDESCLHALERIFADNGIEVITATNAQDALEVLRKNEIAVLIADHRMPGLTGIELLAKAKNVSPCTVKILMTAYAELSTAIEAINVGEAFRFIVKPWKDEELTLLIRESVERYRIVKSLRKKDEALLRSLAETIELKDPYTKDHCRRVAQYALRIARKLDLSQATQDAIKFGSWLHDCGKIGVPEVILNFPGFLNPEEFKTIRAHPEWGARIALEADLSTETVNIILYHHEKYDGSGYPTGLKKDEIPIEARIVSIADVFDALTSERPYRKAHPLTETLDIMSCLRGSAFDPELLDMFLALIRSGEGEE